MEWLTSIWHKVVGLTTRNQLILLLVMGLILKITAISTVLPYSPSHDGCHYMLLGRSLARSEGYVNHVLYAPRFNQERQDGVKDRIPFADFQRPPLYPFLLSVVYRVVGDSYFGALLVNAVLGSLIPLIGFWLAQILFKDRAVSLFTGLLLVFSGTLAAYTIETMLEFTFVVLVGLFLVLFLYAARERRPILVLASGVLWGVCWYARHEALYVLFLPVMAEVLIRFGVKRGALLGFGAALIAAVCIAPWHYRAYLITGNPFHSELKYHLFAAYVDYHEFFTQLSPLPDWSISQFMLMDPWARIERYVMMLFELGVQVPGALLQSSLLLLAVGLVIRARGVMSGVFLGVWTLASLAFFSLTFAEERFLYTLIPLLTAFAAAGIIYWMKTLPLKGTEVKSSIYFVLMCFLLYALFRAGYSSSVLKRTGVFGHWPVFVGLIVASVAMAKMWARGCFDGISRRFLGVFLLFTVFGHFAFGFSDGIREGRKVRYSPELVEWLAENTAPDDVVMIYRKPYYWGWVLDRNMMQLPQEDLDHPENFYPDLKKLIEIFHDKWIVIKVVRKKDGRLVNTHGWLPEEIPYDGLTHVTRLVRPMGKGQKADLFDIYRVDGPLVVRPAAIVQIKIQAAEKKRKKEEKLGKKTVGSDSGEHVAADDGDES